MFTGRFNQPPAEVLFDRMGSVTAGVLVLGWSNRRERSGVTQGTGIAH